MAARKKKKSLGEERLEFAEKYYTVHGYPFTSEGRPWVKNELFIPASSFKLWPANQERVCQKCLDRKGEFVDWSPQLVQRLNKHAKTSKDCDGLIAYPVMVTVLALKRGTGKTVNVFAFVLAAMATDDDMLVGYIASAGDQMASLAEEGIIDAITMNPKLSKNFYTKGDKIYRKGAHVRTLLEMCTTSFSSITGARRDLYVTEEARDIDVRTISRLLFTIKARSRFVCKHRDKDGAHCTHRQAYKLDETPKCPHHKRYLHPKVARMVIPSSLGKKTGSRRDWLPELVEKYQEQESPYVHLYDADDAANPDVSDVEEGMIEEVFGDLASLASEVRGELDNTALGEGEHPISPEHMTIIMDRNIGFLEGSLAEGFAFLDTSETGELTNLAIVLDDQEFGRPLYERTRLARGDIWDPAATGGKIDENLILAHLDKYVPLFPNVERWDVDTRGGLAWAVNLVKYVRAHRPWGHKVFSYNIVGARGQQERNDAWVLMMSRGANGTFRLPKVFKRFRDEINGAKKVYTKRGWVVEDINRKVMHLEITDSAAQCLRRIFIKQTQPSSMVSDFYNADGSPRVEAEAVGKAVDALMDDEISKPLTADLWGLY